MEEEKQIELEEIGIVTDFFSIPSAAAIKITKGTLKVGETILIKGHTTDLTQTVESMQIEKEVIREAKAGDLIGVKVGQKVRHGDHVYKKIASR